MDRERARVTFKREKERESHVRESRCQERERERERERESHVQGRVMCVSCAVRALCACVEDQHGQRSMSGACTQEDPQAHSLVLVFEASPRTWKLMPPDLVGIEECTLSISKLKENPNEFCVVDKVLATRSMVWL